MITVIRRYFKSGSQVALWVVLFSFILGLMPTAFKQVTQSAQWALRVNGHSIDYQIFNLETTKQRERIAAFRAQYGEYADWLLASMDSANPQNVALRVLARQEVVNQFAKTLGIEVSPEYIVRRMSDPLFVQEELGGVIPAYLLDQMGGINCDMLGKYLRHYGISGQLFEENIERVLTEKLMLDLVMATFYIPQFDLNQYMFAHHAKRNFSILTFSLAPILAEQKKKSLSDAQIAQFYDEHNQKSRRYWVPEKRSGMVWTFEPKNYKIEISHDEISDYYEKNKIKMFLDKPATMQVRRILCAATSSANREQMREKAYQIREQLRADSGKFSHLAKTMSDDADTAQNGGLMAPFARGSQEQALDRAAFLLPEDGALSDVIETSKGYEILQRVAKKPQTFKSLTSVRDEIRQTMMDNKFNQMFVADIKRVVELDSASGNDAALLALVKDKGGKPQLLDNKLLDGTPIIQQLFALKGSGDADSFVEDQKGMAIKLTNIEPSFLPSLESIKKSVMNDIYNQMAQDELNTLIQNAKKDLANASLEDIRGKYRADLTRSGWLESDNSEIAKALKKKGISVNEMLQLEKKDTVITQIGTDKGYLIRLDEIVPISDESSAQKSSEIRQKFQEERMAQYQEGFIASLYRNATIETNDSLVTIQE